MAARHNPVHKHLQPRQFNRKLTRDPGDQTTPKFGSTNTSKTMTIDRPKIKKAPKIHPHRRHAGARAPRVVPAPHKAK